MKKSKELKVPIPKKEDVIIPKWYRRKAKLQYKKELVDNIIIEYSKPTKIKHDKKVLEFIPDEKEINNYRKDLLKLNVRQLLEVNSINKSKKVNKVKSSFNDSFNNLKRKKAMLVRIYHKNGNYSDRITSRHSRVIKVDDGKYLMPPNMSTYDIKQQMFCYSYFEGNPFPMEFHDDRPGTIPDAELLEKTLHFEFAQKMAQMTELRKKIDLTFIFSVLAFASGCSSVLIGLLIAKNLNIF